jgi:dihydroxyacetone kinase-like predicted kinase
LVYAKVPGGDTGPSNLKLETLKALEKEMANFKSKSPKKISKKLMK